MRRSPHTRIVNICKVLVMQFSLCVKQDICSSTHIFPIKTNISGWDLRSRRSYSPIHTYGLNILLFTKTWSWWRRLRVRWSPRPISCNFNGRLDRQTNNNNIWVKCFCIMRLLWSIYLCVCFCFLYIYMWPT